ncbi:MAG: hypothetical protein AAGA68_00925 [Pseudomonadota bacterium]
MESSNDDRGRASAPTPSARLARLRHPTATAVLVLTILSAGLIILLWRIRIGDSAMLYVGVPYVIAVALLVFARNPRTHGLKATYGWLVRTSLWILFSTALVLQEGFICVLFFIPIYLLVITAAYGLIRWVSSVRSRERRLRACLLPSLLLLSALEGVTPVLTVPTHAVVAATRVVRVTPEEIRTNLANPPSIDTSANLVLALFPMPYAVETGDLSVGAIHRAHYRYHRWFFTNTHEGTTTLRIAESTPTRLAAQVIWDSSYLAKYLAVHEVVLEMVPRADGRTAVTIAVDFDRKLSPAWYFSPLEAYAVRRMANHLIQEVLADG